MKAFLDEACSYFHCTGLLFKLYQKESKGNVNIILPAENYVLILFSGEFECFHCMNGTYWMVQNNDTKFHHQQLLTRENRYQFVRIP